MSGLHTLSFLFLMVVNSCAGPSASQESVIKTLYIDSKLVDCQGVGPQKCMLIRESEEDEWTYFYDTIDGFDYEEGFTYKIEVSISQIANPPADGSSLAYSLVKVISKEKAGLSSKEREIMTQSSPRRIIYEATTRGFFERIEITSDSIKKTNDRGKTTFISKGCKKEDWRAITATLQPIDLEEIGTLQAPSDKRMHDGAAVATVMVLQGDIKYRSIPFDHKNPPTALKSLVNQILSLAESIE